MSWSRRHALTLLAALPLAGCGFEPLYGSGGPAQRLRGQVRVAAIAGRDGYFLRERLLQRFGTPAADAPLLLSVTLTTVARPLAITQTNDITRYSLAGEAAFSLRLTGDPDPLLEDVLEGDASYNAPASVPPAPPTASTISARAAEQDAGRRLAEYLAEQIADRVLIAAELLSR